MPLELTAGHELGAAGGWEDAVCQPSCLGVGRVETVELFFQLAELVLQVEKESVVQGLEATVDGLDGSFTWLNWNCSRCAPSSRARMCALRGRQLGCEKLIA